MAPNALRKLIVLAALVALSRGGRLTDCELAIQLYGHGIAESTLPDWVCLAIHESALNTSAVGGPNKNGSYDFGIFQINSRWWCGMDGEAGGCHIKCSDLIDDDISDDIECAKIIYGERGFYAWNAWKSKCDGQPLPDISDCFDTTTTTTETTPTEHDVIACA